MFLERAYLSALTGLARVHIPMQFFKDALPVAACFVANLGSHHRNDADYLSLCCKPVRIEFVGGPRQIVVHAVEAHVEQMLSLLCRTPTVPARRLIGASDRWQPRDGYEIAVLVNSTGLSQLA